MMRDWWILARCLAWLPVWLIFNCSGCRRFAGFRQLRFDIATPTVRFGGAP
jgi:hypothetical protein